MVNFQCKKCLSGLKNRSHMKVSRKDLYFYLVIVISIGKLRIDGVSIRIRQTIKFFWGHKRGDNDIGRKRVRARRG